jgi:hypothetical protein
MIMGSGKAIPSEPPSLSRGKAQRQIEDAIRKMRGQVKSHELQDHGRVSKFRRSVKKARRRARSAWPENTICRKNEEGKGPTLHFRCNLSRVDAAAPKHYRSNCA